MEKQIKLSAALNKQVDQLQKQNKELTEQVKELTGLISTIKNEIDNNFTI